MGTTDSRVDVVEKGTSKAGNASSGRPATKSVPTPHMPLPQVTHASRLTTQAWVLRRGKKNCHDPGLLELVDYELPELTDEHVLVEPIVGAWEANMSHCMDREPIDICRIRREPFVVLGNSGVVRVVRTGARVTNCQEGDLCLVVPIGSYDQYGHMIRVFGYDQPNMMGIMAKQAVLHWYNVTPLARPTAHALERWAGFSVRYATAWENWKLSYNAWKSQHDLEDWPLPHLSGWGGGVTLGMAQLAQAEGCAVSVVASTDYRLELLRKMGIQTIDRRGFPDLVFDEEQFETDRKYRARYLQSEGRFLEEIDRVTCGERASIFVDNIGGPVFRALVRALSRLGILTTSGWKNGKLLSYDRTIATFHRHIYLHVHGCRRTEGLKAVEYAEQHGWLPPEGCEVYDWEDIPQLAADYNAGRIESYAPVYRVNPL